jgi:hypothetical protein
MRAIINPRGWRDSMMRRLSRRTGFIAEIRKDIMQAKWFVINLRIGGIFLFMAGLLCIWLAILAMKS